MWFKYGWFMFEPAPVLFYIVSGFGILFLFVSYTISIIINVLIFAHKQDTYVSYISYIQSYIYHGVLQSLWLILCVKILLTQGTFHLGLDLEKVT